MDQVRPAGEVFLDARGNGRALRLTWHYDAELVVLSLWRAEVCTGTFRLALGDVDNFVDALVDGLRGAPDVQLAGDAVAAVRRGRLAELADLADDEPAARLGLPQQNRREDATPAAEPKTGQVTRPGTAMPAEAAGPRPA